MWTKGESVKGTDHLNSNQRNTKSRKGILLSRKTCLDQRKRLVINSVNRFEGCYKIKGKVYQEFDYIL